MASLSNTAEKTISNTADKAKSAINAGLANVDSNTIDQLNHFRDEAMDKAAAYYEQSERYIRKNPFYFIGGAAVLGCLAGLLLSRKN